MKTIAGRYQVLEEIGRGGMGIVYRALDRLNNEEVALKQVTISEDQLDFAERLSQSETINLRYALASEFKMLASLRHPNIISVLDYGFDNRQHPYFTMELLTEAQTIIEAGEDLTSDDRVELLIQLLQALAYLHRRKIIHRDLKPDNIMVIDGVVKVLDFGLAITRDYSKESDTLVGTFAYLAPEVLMGGAASEASDLYAIGLIAYELLAGEYPYDLTNIGTLVQDIVQNEVNIETVRADPRIKAMIDILLEKDPANRQTSAQSLIQMYAEATEQESRYETDLIRDSFLQGADFVGRQDELQKLSTALQQITDAEIPPTGSVWLISGEAGVGKSRLIEEVRTLALVEGALVLRGQGVKEDRAPYALWRDVMRHLSLQTELSDLEAGVIKAIVPEIEQFLGRPVSDAPELSPKDAQERLLSTIIDILGQQTQAIVLLLEDLHWAEESLLLLETLRFAIVQMPLIVIGTYRREEQVDLAHRLPFANIIQLERLSRDEVAALTTSMLGDIGESHDHIVQYLNKETEGNAFFIVEVVRTLAETAGQLNQIGKITLPEHVLSGGMQQVISQRLASLPEWTQELLEIAATIGRVLDIELIKVIYPKADISRWLQVCADAHIVEVQDDEWRFVHNNIRDTLLDILPHEIRVKRHHQVALAMETLYGDDSTYSSLLAHHWSMAQNHAKEAHYSKAAARLALSNGIAEEAVRLFERAIELLLDIQASKFEIAKLEQQLGEAYLLMGRLEESIEHSESAFKYLGRSVPQSRFTFILGLLGQLLKQFWTRQTAQYTKVLSKNPKNAARLLTAARVSNQMVQIFYFRNQAIQGIYYAIRELNFTEVAGIQGKRERSRSYGSLSYAMAVFGRRRLHQLYAELADRAAAETTDLDVQSWVSMTVGMVLSGHGKWATALQRLERASVLSQQLGHTRRWTEASSLIAAIHFYQGEWDKARELYDAIYDIALRHRDLQYQAWSLSQQGAQHIRLGRTSIGLGELQRSIPLYEDAKDTGSLIRVYGLLVQAHTREQQLDEAQRYVEKIEKEIGTTDVVRLALADSYFGLAEYYLKQYEINPNELTREVALESCNRLHNYAKIFDSGLPIAKVYKAWYYGIRGDMDKQLKFTEEALKLAQILTMPFEEALANFHAGRLLPKEHPQRNVYLEQALTIFQEFEVVWGISEVQKSLET